MENDWKLYMLCITDVYYTSNRKKKTKFNAQMLRDYVELQIMLGQFEDA